MLTWKLTVVPPTGIVTLDTSGDATFGAEVERSNVIALVAFTPSTPVKVIVPVAELPPITEFGVSVKLNVTGLTSTSVVVV